MPIVVVFCDVDELKFNDHELRLKHWFFLEAIFLCLCFTSINIVITVLLLMHLKNVLENHFCFAFISCHLWLFISGTYNYI